MKSNAFVHIKKLNETYFRFGKRNSIKLVSSLVTYLMLAALSIIFLVPFFFMFSRSLMSTVDLADINVQWVPRHLSVKNFVYAAQALDFGKRLLWSMTITVLAVLGQTMSASFVGYGLARIRFRGNGLFFALIIFTLLIPPQTIIMAQYLMYAGAGLLDTAAPIVLPAFFTLGLNGGLFVFLFRQFYKSMPGELENAALIDGTGIFGAYFRIMMPNSGSILLVSTILSFIWQWNNYFEPTLFIKDVNRFTLVMMLSNLWVNAASTFTKVGFTSGINLAATVLSACPPIIIFLILQRRFIKGIETSGLAN